MNTLVNARNFVDVEENISKVSLSYCTIRPPYTGVARKVIRNLRVTPKDFVILLPKTLVPDEKIIKLAAFLTCKSFDKGTNISKHVPIQFLLNLFATRQIRDAMKIIDKYWKDEVIAIEVKMELSEENPSLISSLRRSNVVCEDVKSVEGDLKVLLREVYRIPDVSELPYHVKDRYSDYLMKSILTKIAYFGAISSK